MDADGLIGRREDLSRITRFVQRVGVSPCALLLEGDAGIGKTTLWRIATAEAAAAGRRVLR
jgi:hypothetical protein